MRQLGAARSTCCKAYRRSPPSPSAARPSIGSATGVDVDVRTAGAEMSATYLFAGVKVVTTYKLYNVNRSRLENLLHRFFAAARLDVDVPDRFGRTVHPREWFLVPLHVIDEVIKRIQDRTITEYAYDPKKASLIRVASRRS